MNTKLTILYAYKLMILKTLIRILKSELKQVGYH